MGKHGLYNGEKLKMIKYQFWPEKYTAHSIPRDATLFFWGGGEDFFKEIFFLPNILKGKS